MTARPIVVAGREDHRSDRTGVVEEAITELNRGDDAERDAQRYRHRLIARNITNMAEPTAKIGNAGQRGEEDPITTARWERLDESYERFPRCGYGAQPR